MNVVQGPADQPEPPAVTAGRVLVASLVAHGVRDVVLAPGSRSAPLAYALADADAAGTLRLHVRIDERSAGFLALGLAKGAAHAPGGTGAFAPVAVVTTSGTATANLHPAVLEAHHTGVPLVLVTADRPHELRGTGANQTTDQTALYGPAVRATVDVPAPDGRPGETADLVATVGRALAAALGARTGDPGPVHLDVAYREPLAPAPGSVHAAVVEGLRPGTVVVRSTTAATVPVVPDGTVPDAVAHLLAVGPDEVPTVLVAGDAAGRWARELAEARGWPVLAEPSSGAAGGPNAVVAHRLVLGAEALAGRVRRAVVVGRPTLSRPVQRLLARPDVAVVVVAPGGAPWTDATRTAALVLPGVPARWHAAEAGPGAWLDRWRAASDAARAVISAAARTGSPLDGLAVADAVAGASAPDDVLVVGSSNPVRDLDLVLGDDPPAVVANRGLAGIDGLVSTATGIALTAGRRTRALLGDLTFLHDAGGLLRGPLEPAPDLQVVVVNDGGGSIFATLEQGDVAAGSGSADATFERVFGTPHRADLGALCAGYGVGHVVVTTRSGLDAALVERVRGTRVVEVRVGRADRRERGNALASAVQEAVGQLQGQDS